ncbi:MAG: exonuclease domain-containing protein, partial [Pseudomonadota bacterium]
PEAHREAYGQSYRSGTDGKPALPMDRSIDTVAMARRKFPGSPASLDALCRRFRIDNSARTLHGALLDSEILAEVYLELIGGRQPDFGLAQSSHDRTKTSEATRPRAARPTPLPSLISEDERAQHAAFVQKLGEGALWDRFD